MVSADQKRSWALGTRLGYAIPPSLAFMLYAALEEKNCDVICIRPIRIIVKVMVS